MTQHSINTHARDRRQGMDRADAVRYLADFDLDPASVGSPISAGRQHTIFTYGDAQVMKIPNRSLYMRLYGAFTYAIIQRDVDLLAAYLPDYLPPTQVLRSHRDADDYVILQQYFPTAQFISGREFPRVRDHFARIVAANRRLIEEHRLSIDFFGNHSFQKSLWAAVTGQKDQALINNLVMVETEAGVQLWITDTNLSELRLTLSADVNFFHWGIDNGLFLLTRWMIARLFGLSV